MHFTPLLSIRSLKNALAYFQDLLTNCNKIISDARSEVGNAVEFQKKCEDLQEKVSALQKEIQRMVRSSTVGSR